jgi:hypothetical protein
VVAILAVFLVVCQLELLFVVFVHKVGVLLFDHARRVVVVDVVQAGRVELLYSHVAPTRPPLVVFDLVDHWLQRMLLRIDDQRL